MSNHYKKNSFAVFIISFLILFNLFSCSPQSNSKNNANNSLNSIELIEIAPLLNAISIGTKIQLYATSFDKSGIKKDATQDVEWRSADENIFKVSGEGKLEALTSGTGEIIATINNISSSIDISVNNASLVEININPANPEINVDTAVQLSAYGLYDDGSKINLTDSVTWQVATNAFVSHIGNSFTGERVGTNKVTASINGILGSTNISVNKATLTKLIIDLPTDTFYTDNKIELKAIGVFSDGNKQNISQRVEWTFTSDKTVQVVRDKNTLLLKGDGIILLTAKLNEINQSKTIQVSPAALQSIVIESPRQSIPAGKSIQLKAIGLYADGEKIDLTQDVTWTSSDNTTFAISNVITFEGKAISKRTGDIEVFASVGNISGKLRLDITDATLTAIEISPSQKNMINGTSVALIATGIYSNDSTVDITNLVSWYSDNTAVIHVNNQREKSGLATGLLNGSANISASLDNILSTQKITVNNASLVEIYIRNFVSNAIIGTHLSLEAIGIYSNGKKQSVTNQVLWNSSNIEIATISNNEFESGILKLIKAGSSKISVTYQNISISETIVVNDAVLSELILQPDLPSIAIGNTLQFKATGVLSDGSTQDMTQLVDWKTDSPLILNGSNSSKNKGHFEALTSGQANVSAELKTISATTLVIVTNSILSSIEVSHQNSKIANNALVKLRATGIYDDGTHRDITQEILWKTNNPDVIMMSNTENKNGFAYSLAEGVAIITARKNDISGHTTITVSDKILEAISILSNNSGTIAAGYSDQLRAIGNYSDGSTLDISNQVTWQSSSKVNCNISTSEAGFGLLLAKNTGTCFITARLNKISSTQIFEISDATLNSISIATENNTVAKGTETQFIATGFYSDNSSSDISHQVNWQSSGNNIDQNGWLSAVAVGDYTIAASYENISTTSSITITASTLQQIAISAVVDSEFIAGTNKSFVAIGTYSDQSTQDISRSVLWQSSDSTIASVSNSTETAGEVTSLTTGNVTFTAKLKDVISNNLNLTIVDNPQAPISLSQTATPFIILNDNTDMSTIEINVQASNSNQNILDGTVIELEIISGDGTLSSNTVTTLNGRANFSLTSASKGLITIKSKIVDTELENKISLYVTDTFSIAIARYGFASGTLENDLVLTGSQFGLLLLNFSNRPFAIDGFRVFNENNIVAETDDAKLLNNNLLSAGESVNVIYKTTQTLSNNYVVAYYLREPVTGQQFVIAGGFKLKKNANQ